MGLFDPRHISTQQHLDIEDIRDNYVILKNGKVSIVIETTSLNFDLLAGREQDARIFTFASLLNALQFPIQIVIRTQQTDTSKYLALLEDYKRRVAATPLLQQVEIYQTFIRNLTDNTQILNKRFYVIIPSVTSAPVVKTNPLKTLFGKQERIVNVEQLLEKAKAELTPKRDAIVKQLDNMGLYAKQLENDELIKLYYSIYEPDKVGLDVMQIREDALQGAVVNTQVKNVEPAAAPQVTEQGHATNTTTV